MYLFQLPQTMSTEVGIFDLILSAGFFSKFILISLAALSIVAWAITIGKFRQYKNVISDFSYFQELLRPNVNVPTLYARAIQKRTHVYSQIFEDAYYTYNEAWKDRERNRKKMKETKPEESGDETPVFEQALKLRVEGSINTELSELNIGTPLLATVVTISPFIGLLGTVWGVLQSFLSIGMAGSADLAVVAPGIAEALITTVAGLLVAIPAVFCNNSLAAKLHIIEDDLNRLGTELTIYFFQVWHQNENTKSESTLRY